MCERVGSNVEALAARELHVFFLQVARSDVVRM
jgi:hypothetical protein